MTSKNMSLWHTCVFIAYCYYAVRLYYLMYFLLFYCILIATLSLLLFCIHVLFMYMYVMFYSTGYREVMPLVWKRMNEPGKNWRIVYKVSN